MEKFIRSVLDIHPLPPADLNRLLEAGEEMDIAKGTALIREGDVNRSLYLLKSGVMRAYLDNGERQITIWFAVPGEAVFSSWGYLEDSPSRIVIGASCDCTALRYSREKMETLFSESPALNAWGRKLFLRLLLSTDQGLVDYAKPLAKERYMTMLEKTPEILLNVPLKEIAGYLSMTPQSLSRIRTQIAKKR